MTIQELKWIFGILCFHKKQDLLIIEHIHFFSATSFIIDTKNLLIILTQYIIFQVNFHANSSLIYIISRILIVSAYWRSFPETLRKADSLEFRMQRISKSNSMKTNFVTSMDYSDIINI